MSRLFDALKKIEGAGGKADDAGPASTVFSGVSQAPTAPPWWRKRIFYYLLFSCFTVMLGGALLIYLHGIAPDNSPLPVHKPFHGRSLGQGGKLPDTVLPPPVLSSEDRLQPAGGKEAVKGGNAHDPGVLVAGVKNVEKKMVAANVHHEVNGGSQPYFQTSSAGVSGIRKTKEVLSQRDKAQLPPAGRGRFSVTEKKLLQQAEELRNAGKIQAAMAIYRKLWNKNPTPEVGNNLAACYMISGLYQKARQVLEKSLKLSPGDPDLLYNLRLVSGRLQGPLASSP